MNLRSLGVPLRTQAERAELPTPRRCKISTSKLPSSCGSLVGAHTRLHKTSTRTRCPAQTQSNVSQNRVLIQSQTPINCP